MSCYSRMWYILLCVTLSYSGADPSDLKGTSGKVQFEGSTNEGSRSWNITVPEWLHVKIYNIIWNPDPSQSCEKNYIQLTSWGVRNDSRRLCPAENVSRDREYHLQSNKVTLTFTSEASRSRKPVFEALFVAEGHCITTVYTEPSGVITSPPYDSNHPKNYVCRYNIHTEGRRSIHLKFVEFSLDDGGDDTLCSLHKVQITAGAKELAPLCGDLLPPDIEILGNKVELLFRSTNYGEHKRWKIEYTTQDIYCGTPPEIDDGTITFITGLNETKYNAKIQYECRSPYYYMKDGKGTYRCGADGVWEDILTLSRDLPVCVPDCALKRDTASSRIIGGRNAQLCQFPWQAHIMAKNSRGAGALLYDKWIITTASSLQEADLSQFMIKLGITSLREENYIQGEPGEVFIHKDYGKGTIDYDNDIALIKLKNKIPIGENVQGICLPTKESHFHISHRESDHHVGIVAGFGKTEMSRISSRLLFVEVDVVEQQTCREAYQKTNSSLVSENMICAGHAEGGRDTCVGDTGTALAFLDAKSNKWFIGGIASWGPANCGDKHYPGVYTRVSNYLDWIENIINNN